MPLNLTSGENSTQSTGVIAIAGVGSLGGTALVVDSGLVLIVTANINNDGTGE